VLGDPLGETDGDALGEPLAEVVGDGSVPPPALPPLQVYAPVVAVFPAATVRVVPVEKVTVMALLPVLLAT
jgi:hypothetical protein